MNLIEEVTALRADLWAAGYRPVPLYTHDHPVKDAGKRPLGEGWQIDARKDPPFCADHPAVKHALNSGILCDGLRAIDLDIDDPELAAVCRSLVIRHFGDAPIRTRQNSARCALLYRASSGQPGKRTIPGASHDSKIIGRSCKIEILGKGQQLAAFGVHPSGSPLEWSQRLQEHTAALLTAVTEDQVDAFVVEAATILDAPAPTKPNGHDAHEPAEPQADPLRIAAALAQMPNDAPADWEKWNRVGMAIWAATGGGDMGWATFNQWSQRNASYDAAETRGRWDHYFTSPPTQIGAGTIFHMAAEARRLNGHATPEPPPDDRWEPPPEPPPEPEPEPSKQEGAPHAALQGSKRSGRSLGVISEGAVADAFTAQYRVNLRYCHHTGKWFVWNGMRWKREETKLAYRWAHDKAKLLAASTKNARTIRDAGKAAFAGGVERLAQADRAFAVTSEIWDSNSWLLGTPGGTVDLHTGTLRPAVQDEYITKSTAVTPSATAHCPTWLAFLDQATQSNKELIAYLQRWFGYCLTGEIREHAMTFVYGPGGNGKGTLVNTAFEIMGDYAMNAAMDTFVSQRSEKHTTDVAMLHGARWVLTTEVDEGQVWAEARIKSLTGGDPITARFMRQDNFTFTPKFKLTVSGNHKPGLRNVDDAVRRRMNIIPFLFKPPKPDKTLHDRLKPEWPGILRWMINGCLAWQKSELNPPDVVIAATQEYFASQDTLRQWIEERCITGKGNRDTNASLFGSWREYLAEANEKPGSQKRFAHSLQREGYVPVKNPSGAGGFRGRGFEGLRVLPPLERAAAAAESSAENKAR